jgi:hypothetical protein
LTTAWKAFLQMGVYVYYQIELIYSWLLRFEYCSDTINCSDRRDCKIAGLLFKEKTEGATIGQGLVITRDDEY